MVLDKAFYIRSDVTQVAEELLGKVLITRKRGVQVAGIIVETEAYSYHEKGCHAYQGKLTKRNRIMFEMGGCAYVYLCYGIHHMFNVVTNREGIAEAVLVRAVEPVEGLEVMQRRMGSDHSRRITSGPGKLAKAMGIDRSMNGIPLDSAQLWLEDRGVSIRNNAILRTPRIGIAYAGQDAARLWRFSIKDNKWVSK
jgi:DNA-3-methyladenine glycosylase